MRITGWSQRLASSIIMEVWIIVLEEQSCVDICLHPHDCSHDEGIVSKLIGRPSY